MLSVFDFPHFLLMAQVSIPQSRCTNILTQLFASRIGQASPDARYTCDYRTTDFENDNVNIKDATGEDLRIPPTVHALAVASS